MSNHARLVEAVIVTPIRVLVLFIFVGAAYTYVIKRGWEKWRMARIQEKLSDHIVVLGFGVSGAEAVCELIERPVLPEEIGRSLHDLATGGRGLRIYRNGGACGFWEAEAGMLQEGDVVVEIRPTGASEAGD